MKADKKSAVKKIRGMVFTPKLEPEEFRSNFDREFSTVFLPNNVECAERDYGGIKCDVISPLVYSSRRVIIYIHGGSFVGGSRAAYRNFCASLAHASSCRVIVPEFRLPPTYPFPAAIDDLVNVFRSVYEEENVARRLEISASGLNDANARGHIIISADGSGASLAMALIFKINKKYRSNIQDLILFSPWLDMSRDNPVVAGGRKCNDGIMSGDSIHFAVDKYTYAANISNPLVSPLQAPTEDFEEFPQVYVQMGEDEILVRQARDLKEKLSAVGVACVLDLWPGMMYMFQMADEYLPDSHLAVNKVGEFIREREGDTEEEIEERIKISRKNNIFQIDGQE
ncbi:MAG: alpha/beta hydrolase fold domain-containing protein [Treponema sp.]|nr:alpha/beta hydrolase fold domain-containing protein [Treponema sp.]